jgi:hypothetical protein
MSDDELDDDEQLSAEELKKLLAGKQYLDEVPWEIPKGKILVHNHVAVPSREEFYDMEFYELGLNGFRAWLCDPDPDTYEVCPCDWCAELGDHYRVIAAWR